MESVAGVHMSLLHCNCCAAQSAVALEPLEALHGDESATPATIGPTIATPLLLALAKGSLCTGRTLLSNLRSKALVGWGGFFFGFAECSES